MLSSIDLNILKSFSEYIDYKYVSDNQGKLVCRLTNQQWKFIEQLVPLRYYELWHLSDSLPVQEREGFSYDEEGFHYQTDCGTFEDVLLYIFDHAAYVIGGKNKHRKENLGDTLFSALIYSYENRFV